MARKHLMNVKRIAWESRGIEDRTIPAESTHGGSRAFVTPTRQGKKRMSTSSTLFTDYRVLPARVEARNPTVSGRNQSRRTANLAATGTGVSVLPDRAAIAQSSTRHAATESPAGVARRKPRLLPKIAEPFPQ